jgi:molybdopterin/thiamine biosynthesis adenylyltransferase/rhodanese-related sulfurtransferase
MQTKRVKVESSLRYALENHGPEQPLLDIRDALERSVGAASGSVPYSAEEILARANDTGPNELKSGFVMCAAGVRSRALVESLQRQGFNGFSSVSGGFHAWRDEGLPVDFPAGIDARGSQRYARHLVMPQVGPEGQRKLLESRVLLIGMGGLNSPAAMYLAAAGVGTLGLVDDDLVERSNLQRQIIHSEANVGLSKVVSAKQHLLSLNPDITIESYELRISEQNALEQVQNWDLVIDGSDNFATRYVLNKACLEAEIPLVYGAVMRFQGQVSVFWPGHDIAATACFRCLFPQAPADGEAPGCAVAGVLGVMPGIVGTLQACEALKILLGIGQPLLGRLLMIDVLNMDFHETRIEPNPACPDGAV